MIVRFRRVDLDQRSVVNLPLRECQLDRLRVGMETIRAELNPTAS